MTYNIVGGRLILPVFSIFLSLLLLIPCVYPTSLPIESPAVVNIEVEICADGTINVDPDPAVVDDEDEITWHIKDNAWGAKSFTLTLPGPRYPVQPGGTHTIENPAHCDYVTYDGGTKEFVCMWPPGYSSYTYGVDASKSPESISAYARLIKPSAVGGIWVPVNRFGLLAPYIGLASTIVVATAATAIYAKRVKSRKEKQ